MREVALSITSLIEHKSLCRPLEQKSPNARARSLHRHGLGEVARLIHIRAHLHCCVIGDELNRDGIQDRRDQRMSRGSWKFECAFTTADASSASLKTINWPPRAATSCMLETIFS